MTDQVDRAQAFDQMRREIILNQRVPRSQHSSGCTHCIDCKEPIPEVRRAAVPETKYCTFCAEQKEKRGP